MYKFLKVALALLSLFAMGTVEGGLRAAEGPSNECPSPPEGASDAVRKAYDIRMDENCDYDDSPIVGFKMNAGSVVKAQCADCGRYCLGATCCCKSSGWLCQCDDH